MNIFVLIAGAIILVVGAIMWLIGGASKSIVQGLASKCTEHVMGEFQKIEEECQNYGREDRVYIKYAFARFASNEGEIDGKTDTFDIDVKAAPPAGTPVSIWYDPSDPQRFIITEDPNNMKAGEKTSNIAGIGKKLTIVGIILLVASALLTIL